MYLHRAVGWPCLPSILISTICAMMKIPMLALVRMNGLFRRPRENGPSDNIAKFLASSVGWHLTDNLNVASTDCIERSANIYWRKGNPPREGLFVAALAHSEVLPGLNFVRSPNQVFPCRRTGLPTSLLEVAVLLRKPEYRRCVLHYPWAVRGNKCIPNFGTAYIRVLIPHCGDPEIIMLSRVTTDHHFFSSVPFTSIARLLSATE